MIYSIIGFCAWDALQWLNYNVLKTLCYLVYLFNTYCWHPKSSLLLAVLLKFFQFQHLCFKEVWNCFHPPLLSQFCTICVKISRIFVPLSFPPPHSFSIHVVLIGILAIDNWSDQPADSLSDETAVGRLRYQLRSRSGTNSSDAVLGGLSFLYARKGDRSSVTLSSHGLNGFHFRINSCCCCFLLLLGGQTLSLTDS